MQQIVKCILPAIIIFTLYAVFTTFGVARAGEATSVPNPINSIYIEENYIDVISETILFDGRITKVNFKINNNSNHEITSLLKIPLPAYDPAETDPDNSFNDIDSFSVQINGENLQKVLVDYKAFVKDRDCTHELIDSGIDLSNYASYRTTYGQPPFSDKDQMLYNDLHNNKLVDFNVISFERGGPRYIQIVPLWKVIPSFVWHQRFKANEPLDISYTFAAKGRTEIVEFARSDLPDCGSPYEWYVYNKLIGRTPEELLKITTVGYELVSDYPLEHSVGSFSAYFRNRRQGPVCIEYEGPAIDTLPQYNNYRSISFVHFEHKGKLRIKFIE